MKEYSRQLFHIGINFVTIPGISVTKDSSFAFQRAISDNGLEFSKTQQLPDRIILVREAPSELHISAIAPQQPVGQLIIVAPNPKSTLEIFIQEAEAAINAYETVWASQPRQIVACDATIRELHETTSGHAFKELWEKRLKQSQESLKLLGKAIRGGGLRFVIDPQPQDVDPIQIELKIESFLQNTNKIFIETIFRWPKPTEPGTPFDARERILKMNSYIEDNVLKFLAGGENDD